MSIPPPPPYPPPYPPPPPFPPPPFAPPSSVPARRRRVLPLVLAVVAAVLVLATAIVVPLAIDGDDGSGEPGAGGADAPADLDAVESFDDLPGTHLEVGEDFDYPQSPPVGGRHSPVWLECGAYDEPVPEVNVVHDLEHGTVWLTYRPEDVDAAGVEQLTEALPDNGILSPYPDQDAPVVITVWGRQLALTGPDDPRIDLFLAEYGAGETAPEPNASCHGGVDPGSLPPSGGPVI